MVDTSKKAPLPDPASDAISTQGSHISPNEAPKKKTSALRTDGRVECNEDDNYEHTGYTFSRWKK